MRKLILALTISLVLSLTFGGVMVLAASQAEPGNPLYPINQGLDAAVTFLQDTVNAGDMQTIGDSAVVDETPQILDAEGDDTSVDDPLDDGDDLDDVDEPEEAKESAYCPCDPANPHPAGEKLANKFLGEGDTFETKYTEVMTLFCEGGFGFGEIDKGLGIALVSGVDAAEVFALRDAGMGWGNIRKRYNLPKFPKDPTDPGLGVGPGNGNAGGNGNAYGQANNQGNGNAGGNGNAYGKTKNADKGNKGGKGKP